MGGLGGGEGILFFRFIHGTFRIRTKLIARNKLGVCLILVNDVSMFVSRGGGWRGLRFSYPYNRSLIRLLAERGGGNPALHYSPLLSRKAV